MKYMFGNDYTRQDVLLTLLAGSFVAAGIVLYFSVFNGTASYDSISGKELPLWRVLILAVIGLDIGGGVVANMSAGCKRFYHSQPTNKIESVLKNHLVFVSLHVYPIIIWAIFGRWWVGLIWYLSILLSAYIVYKTSEKNKNTVAACLFVCVAVCSIFIAQISVVGVLLMLLLFAKLILGHMIPPISGSVA
jgi:hypothetical protein